MQSTSDLTIVVEDRRIHVHKALLRMRCVTKKACVKRKLHMLHCYHTALCEICLMIVPPSFGVNNLIFGFILTGVSILIPCFSKVGGRKLGKSKSPVLSYQSLYHPFVDYLSLCSKTWWE